MPGLDALGRPDSSGEVARGVPDLMEGVARQSKSASADGHKARVGQSSARVAGNAEPDGPRVFSGVQPKARVGAAASLLAAR